MHDLPADWVDMMHAELDAAQPAPQQDWVEDLHRELQGVKISIGESFHTRDGDELQFPGDPTADISNRIGCRCWLTTSR